MCVKIAQVCYTRMNYSFALAPKRPGALLRRYKGASRCPQYLYSADLASTQLLTSIMVFRTVGGFRDFHESLLTQIKLYPYYMKIGNSKSSQRCVHKILIINNIYKAIILNQMVNQVCHRQALKFRHLQNKV